MSNTERLVYTIEEARVLLGVSRNHIYDLARRGKLPVVRLGHKYVVPKHRLRAMLDGAEERG